MEAADLYAEGEVNSIDFAYLRKYILGMIKVFPAEGDLPSTENIK